MILMTPDPIQVFDGREDDLASFLASVEKPVRLVHKRAEALAEVGVDVTPAVVKGASEVRSNGHGPGVLDCLELALPGTRAPFAATIFSPWCQFSLGAMECFVTVAPRNDGAGTSCALRRLPP